MYVLNARQTLETSLNLLYRVALRNDEGDLSLQCFRAKFDGYMDRIAQEVHLGNPHAWVDAGAIECVIAHTVQYAQECAYDVNGRLVPPKDRTVLDPRYLADGLDALKKEGNWSRSALQELLEAAPVNNIEDVDITNVAKRAAVLKWQRRLAKNLKKNSGEIETFSLPYEMGRRGRT